MHGLILRNNDTGSYITQNSSEENQAIGNCDGQDYTYGVSIISIIWMEITILEQICEINTIVEQYIEHGRI